MQKWLFLAKGRANSCIILPYDENITVIVVFSPVQQGEQFGTLSIFSNDPNSPNKTIVLLGEGYTVSPAFDRIMYASSGPQNGGELLSVNKETTRSDYWTKLKVEITRITKYNGIVVSCGWNPDNFAGW